MILIVEQFQKVTICHIPPGNPSNPQTISVGAPAVKAHLKHGDYEGECKITNTPQASNSDGKNNQSNNGKTKKGKNKI